MKHQIPDEIIATSELIPLITEPAKLFRWERLNLWADALERHHGQLSALRRLEYLSPDELRTYRGANTPLTIAFDEPALRTAGLSGDSLGDAMDFFELTERDAHRLLCDCHYHGAMTGSGLARRIRGHARSTERRARWARVFRRMLGREP
ncbi:MAG TPA: hypothetical protein VNS34_08815 [Rhizobiaceae bacterium]|nr:hypothetical protein [Rhizobiaceae bacterium]